MTAFCRWQDMPLQAKHGGLGGFRALGQDRHRGCHSQRGNLHQQVSLLSGTGQPRPDPTTPVVVALLTLYTKIGALQTSRSPIVRGTL